MEASQETRDWNHVIALDGGTTNTRARLLDAQGKILATAVRSVGVRNTALSTQGGNRSNELKQAVRQVIEEVLGLGIDREAISSATGYPDAVIAAGMLTADVGLLAVPHVQAPAGLDDLAKGVRLVSLPEVSSCPIHLIPGVRTPNASGLDGWMHADVMRGEEVETFGTLKILGDLGCLDEKGGTPPASLIWPGSHTKLVELDENSRIARSATSLAGELTHAIWNHTLITASLPKEWPSVIDLDAAEAGRRAVTRSGLGRAAFLVRIAALNDCLDPVGRASFWIGAVLAEDAAFLANHPILKLAPKRPVWVGGREPFRGLISSFLRELHPGDVRSLEDSISQAASPIGALQVARRFASIVLEREPGDDHQA